MAEKMTCVAENRADLVKTLRNMAASRWANLYEHAQVLTESADYIERTASRIDALPPDGSVNELPSERPLPTLDELRAVVKMPHDWLTHVTNLELAYIDALERLSARPSIAASGETPSFSNGQKCDGCGAWCIDKCARCGAPQCCPQCCHIDSLERELAEAKALIALQAAEFIRMTPRLGVDVPKDEAHLFELAALRADAERMPQESARADRAAINKLFGAVVVELLQEHFQDARELVRDVQIEIDNDGEPVVRALKNAAPANAGPQEAVSHNSAGMTGLPAAAAQSSATPKGGDDLPLRCEAVGGVLDMRVGVKVLAFATENCDALWDGESDKGTYLVSDPAVFAEEVARELNRESEDGSTRLTRMLDDAIEEAINKGAEGVKERSHEKGQR